MHWTDFLVQEFDLYLDVTHRLPKLTNVVYASVDV